MKYDFDTPVERRNTGCYKWDIIGKDELPMWVADMDFRTAPEILDAMKKRLDHGVFGYNIMPDEWYDSYISWWRRRHGLVFSKDELIFCTGVITALSSVIRKLSTPAEKILIQTPVYNHFMTSILNNGRNIVTNELVYSNGKYSIDFEDLEKKLSDRQTTMMILCNPQNPTGNIWTKEELAKIGALCKKYNVIVLSDEIHCDVTTPGFQYTPFASVDDVCKYNSVTFVAPTKAFNLAGLQTSAVIVYNEFLKNKIDRAFNTDEVAEPNTFAVTAAVSAFTDGEAWLEEMRAYVAENRKVVADFLKSELPSLHLVESNATYLLWIDCSAAYAGNVVPAEHIRKTSGLYVIGGKTYGDMSEKFIRMNIACPRSLLLDGLRRLKAAIDSI